MKTTEQDFSSGLVRLGFTKYCFHFHVSVFLIFPVPTVTFTHTQKHENTKQLATYQSDFGKDYFSIISILNSLDPEQVNKYVENAPEQGRILYEGLF